MDELLPQLVTQDNALIEACYTMTLNEKRLLLLGMSKVNPMSFPDSDLKLSFKLTSDDWKKAFPDSGNAYRDMRKAADSMLTRYLTLHPKTGVTKKISWFDSVEYVENAASVEVVFGYSIQVRLMGMLENFTTMPLLEVGKLSSVYGVRLFELLQQFKKTGVRVISLEDFPREQSYRFSIFASTIFHELMHADFDVLIKRSNSRADIVLSNTQKWFSKNAPRFNAHIAAHEFFGYTASDIIYGIQTQTQDTLMAHGINHIKKECFPVKALKRIKKRLFKDGNIHFKDLERISDYSPRFTPSTVFVKGKSIDLVKLKMPRSIRSSIYQIFVDHYNAPSSSLELINRLEKKYGALLRKCYSF